MTRPEIIRADSIDLQDHGAPSAQNHQARPSPLQTNHSAAHVAPHQAETLREVAAETAEEELRSPRVSWNQGAEAGELQKYAEDLAAGVTSSLGSSDDNTNMSAAHAQQDDLAVAQNGGLVSQDNQDDGDVDADEGDLDDDMMDKISSSPSIDDGGSACQLSSFVRFAKPDAASCSSPASAYCREARSPSPYLDLPNYLPLQRKPTYYQLRPTSRLHHLLGGSSEDLDQTDADPATRADAGHLAGGDGPDEVYESQSDGQPAYGDTVPANGCDLSGAECEREDVLGEQPEQEDEAIEDMEDNFDCSDDLIVPYEDFTDEDDDDSFLLYNDSRFVDSGWGGECLQDTEDIDFELVYALHTFIATVEGQANATKGDAMVLLDDSNSYWWLVRVVKDSSIGYLPAEHIETPTERLARLNKHRNIDLSATMLGDQSDKAKNPLKNAMRRRKAKNVTFAAPTFVDYSDYDYTSDEEEEEQAEILAQQQQIQQTQQQQQQQQSQQMTTKQINGEDVENDDSAKVAPLRPRPQAADPVKTDPSEGVSSAAKVAGRTSEEIFETNGVEGPKKRADGTVRDSFFKDDTVETKKITLTPNLLRDDGTVRASSDSIERGVNKRPSFDKLEKEAREDKKKSKDKKEKDKKGGFRSLFSRDKKKQKGDEDDESFGKRSMDMSSDSITRPSDDIGDDLGEKGSLSPQRNPSKLQKQQPRVEPSLARKAGAPRDAGPGMDLSTFLKNESSLKSVSSVPPASMRIVDPDADLFEDDNDEDEEQNPQKTQPPAASRSAPVEEQKPNGTVQGSEDQASKTSIAKSRMQIEDSESDDESVQEIVQRPVAKEVAEPESQLEQQRPIQEAQQQKTQRPTLPGAFPDSYMSVTSTESTSTVTPAKVGGPPQQQGERLSDSPIEVSPITPTENQPPPLTGDNSSQEDHSSPVSSPSPELIDREEADGTHRNQDSITTSTSTTTVATWNDTNLRAFFDSGTDIRDLLVVVYDKNDVEPVGADHPVAGALFKEQNAKLAEITTQLDNMLGDWLARKQRLRGTV